MVKARYIYTLAAVVTVLTGCEPGVDRSGGSTNNVNPRAETNTVPQINRVPEVVTNSAVTNAAPPRP